MAPGDLSTLRCLIGSRRHALDERLGIELEQPRIVAHQAARDAWTGHAVEALVLQRFDLAREELEPLRDLVDGEARRLARLLKLRAYASKDLVSQRLILCSSSCLSNALCVRPQEEFTIP